MADSAIGLGKFFEKLGGYGMQIGQQYGQMKDDEEARRRNAPKEALNMKLLEDAAKRSDLKFDQEKMSAQRQQMVAQKMETLKKLLSEPEIQEQLAELGKESEMGPRPGVETAPTATQQYDRIKGTEYQYSQEPGIKAIVGDVKKAAEGVAPIQEFDLKKQKFEEEKSQFDIETELKRIKLAQDAQDKAIVDPMKMVREERITSQFDQKQLIDHVKSTKDYTKNGYLLKTIDTALQDTGAGGIFGDGPIASVGFMTKPYREWLQSDEAIKVRQAVKHFFIGKLKEMSGVAVTPQEYERIESAFGLNAKSTVKAFREGMKIAVGEIKQKMGQFEKALSPEVKEIMLKRGLFTTDQLPSAPENENEELNALRTKYEY